MIYIDIMHDYARNTIMCIANPHKNNITKE